MLTVKWRRLKTDLFDITIVLIVYKSYFGTPQTDRESGKPALERGPVTLRSTIWYRSMGGDAIRLGR